MISFKMFKLKIKDCLSFPIAVLALKLNFVKELHVSLHLVSMSFLVSSSRSFQAKIFKSSLMMTIR